MAESLKEHTRSFLNGVVSGIASILPGVSGGLILVLCGSYERLIEDIGHLRSKLVPEFWFLVAIGCGLLVGMGSCMVFLDWALDGYAAPMMAFFFGLILAQIPQVWKLTGYSENTRNPVIPWICLAVGLGIIIALLVVNGGGRAMDTEDHSIGNMVLFALCGMIVAISNVMPGISGSSLLIALGMYEITIGSIVHLELYFVIPLLIGLLIGLFGFAKVMDYCLKRFHTETYMLILGLTIGSLFIIVNELVESSLDAAGWAVCAVMAVLGIIASYAFTLYGRKVSA